MKSTRTMLLQLLQQSEQRIDRTNEMISKLAEAIESVNKSHERITMEYISQIEKLQECRDALAKENIELVKANEKLLCAATEPKHIINNN